MKKTKIVCTLGPAVDDPKIMEDIILAGMDVARFNFSHGDYEEQHKRITLFKEARKKSKKPVAMMLDTKGPEIRIGRFKEGKITLNNGDSFTLYNSDVLGDNSGVSINYKDLYQDIHVDSRILINDGLIELQVTEIKDKNIHTVVLNPGELTDKKSVNVPNLNLNLPSITPKDIEDILFGINNGFDFIAASFIRKPSDVIAIRDVLKENGGEHIKIISKIENREGINNFDEILKVTDGIMVARGDLGVEVPIEEVPVIQKKLIKKAYRFRQTCNNCHTNVRINDKKSKTY